MEAYHLALFGAGNCPGELPVEAEPGVGDKRKWDKANQPVCVALGGETFLYASKDAASIPSGRSADRHCLSIIHEGDESSSANAPSFKSGLLMKTRKASQRAWSHSKVALAGAAASLTSRFTSKKTFATLVGVEVRESPYKKLKVGTQ